MKICFITSNIFSLGGVQRVVSVLANELSKYNDIEILCTSDEYQIDRGMYNLDDRIKVNIDSSIMEKSILTKFYCKLGKIINNNTNLFLKEALVKTLIEIYYPKNIRQKLTKYLNTKEYDVVIGVEGFASVLLGSISDNINSKTIGWQHNSYDAYLKNTNRYYWKQDKIFEAIIPKLDKYLVLTDYDKQMFKTNNDIDCEVMYNPKSFVSERKSDLKSKYFLAAGRFVYQKGFDLLIESFNLFATENKEWNLVIVGEGSEKEKLQKLIKEYKLEERITIQPFTDNIQEYFIETSILLLPSRWEGMPMIVLESFEMGVPVISYDISAAKQLIDDGIHGLLVKKNDVELFSKKMLILSDSYEMRKVFSKNIVELSNEFDLEKIISKWDFMFQNLISVR